MWKAALVTVISLTINSQAIPHSCLAVSDQRGLFQDDFQNRSPMLYFWPAPQSTQRLTPPLTLCSPHASSEPTQYRKWASAVLLSHALTRRLLWPKVQASAFIHIYPQALSFFQNIICQLLTLKSSKRCYAECSAMMLRAHFTQVGSTGDHKQQERREGRGKEEWRGEWSFSIPLHGSL